MVMVMGTLLLCLGAGAAVGAFVIPKPKPAPRLVLHAAAPGKTTTNNPPAQRVQHAVEPEDILRVATEELPALKPAHLAAALLRQGKALVQPKQAERRRRLVKSAEYQALVRAALASMAAAAAGSTNVRHAHDALLGMALAEFPLNAHPDVQAAVEQLVCGGAVFAAALRPGEVSGLAWCWDKLGLDPGALPAALQERLASFPFRVRIGALREDLLNVAAIVEEVALRRDSILLGSKSIEESRLTAWQGPKPFYYSDKEMAPSVMTPRIAAIRDQLEEITGVFYDCVLINLYEDGKTAMRYHIGAWSSRGWGSGSLIRNTLTPLSLHTTHTKTNQQKDPDQGVHWTTNTAVVSIGDTREFCLRDMATKGAEEHHRFWVAQADAVEMVGDCQERYQHCVKVCEEAADAGPRISLVYKQSLELLPS